MNARKTTVTAAVLTCGLFVLAGSVLAQEDQEPAQSNCRRVRAHESGLFDPATNANTGTVTNGGRLNGTFVAAFLPGFAPTQDPTIVTFMSDFSITTDHGVLKARNMYLFDFAGVATVLGRIDPVTSTGRFAGATGTLFSAGRVTSFNPFTTEEDVTADICFAK